MSQKTVVSQLISYSVYDQFMKTEGNTKMDKSIFIFFHVFVTVVTEVSKRCHADF